MDTQRLQEICLAFSTYSLYPSVSASHDVIQFAAPEDIPEELKKELNSLGVRWSNSDWCWCVFV